MTVYFHIGTHKTATTSFQRYLSASRKELLSCGLIYPQYSDLIPTDVSHYAHLDLARSIQANRNSRFTPSEVEAMFESLDKIEKTGISPVISSEPFWRMQNLSHSDLGSALKARERLLEPLFNIVEKPRLCITLRLLPDFVCSMYSEHILQTSYSGNIEDFFRDSFVLFRYEESVNGWAKHGPISIVSYEESLSSANLAYFILNAFTGINSGALARTPTPRANTTIQFALLVYKKYLNSQGISSPKGKEIIDNLVKLLEATEESPISKFANMSWISYENWTSMLDLNAHDNLVQNFSSPNSKKEIRMECYQKAMRNAKKRKAILDRDAKEIIDCLNAYVYK